MRILQVLDKSDLLRIFSDIKVDAYGVEIMQPKADNFLIKINSVSSIAANILKQEMLSLGGDAAVSRDVLTGKVKNTDCLLIGNLCQFNRLNEKLNIQPFGLSRLAKELSDGIDNYQKDSFILDFSGTKLNLTRRTCIMGIVNLTPDSFSGDGFYKDHGCLSLKKQTAIDYTEQLIKDGASIIDIGGESSRPGAKPVGVKEEIRRTIPVIKQLVKKIKVPISIDTYKLEVAKQALDNGASMVNDITGLKNKLMAKTIAQYKAAVVIMHMQGNPRTMQKHPHYNSFMDESTIFLKKGLDLALESGIKENRIVVDPGIGFGKDLEHNLEILKKLKEFKILGQPILVGPSRKSFIGKILNNEQKDRLVGTITSCVLAAKNGANIVRVHDVKQISEALTVSDRIIYS